MSISVSEQKTAERIAAEFNLPGKITGCTSFGSGHINNTDRKSVGRERV